MVRAFSEPTLGTIDTCVLSEISFQFWVFLKKNKLENFKREKGKKADCFNRIWILIQARLYTQYTVTYIG